MALELQQRYPSAYTKNTPSTRHLIRKYFCLALPFWRGEMRWQARGLVLLVIVLLLAQTKLAVLLNIETGAFTSALAERDSEGFWQGVKWSLFLLLAAVPIYATYFYARDTLGLKWRQWMSNQMLDRYLAKHHYLRLDEAGYPDNPDQRIAEDINSFTLRSLYFLTIFLGAIIQLVAFGLLLWSLSHELVYFLIIYASVGTLVIISIFGPPLMRRNYLQQWWEADFRFGLVRLREHAEPIAFYAGEFSERQILAQRFAAVIDNYRHILKLQFGLNFFQHGYGQLTLVLPSVIIAEQVLAGELKIGHAIQAAGAFAAVLAAVSVIVDNFEGLSRFAAGISRLDELSRALPETQADDPQASLPRPIILCGHDLVEIRALSLHLPDPGRRLVNRLNLRVAAGESLFICGPSGSGKSTLLRAIAGIWQHGEGNILLPNSDSLCFVPQQPYLVLGSLRQQLAYPKPETNLSDSALLAILAEVNLEELPSRVGGLDAYIDWEAVLSVGEQQRLAFARLFVAAPRFVILDEATSALDSANENALYQAMCNRGMTLISVAHRPELKRFHRQCLELKENGGWHLSVNGEVAGTAAV